MYSNKGHWKNENVLKYEGFVDIFWGHHKTGLILGVISMHFRSFLRIMRPSQGGTCSLVPLK